MSRGDYIQFKPLKDSSILMREGMPLPSQKSNYLGDSSHELLYKLVKTDGKLIRTVLEANGFNSTEGHDWNILWCCQSLKPYMYEGLNDY